MTDAVEIRRSESHFDGAAGLRLFARSWVPPNPTRSLLLVHGYAEHSGRYDHVGAWFAARGFAVHAYDHQGHGHSGGTRCHVNRFDDFLDDLDGMLERVREEAPKRPLFVVGHSMGGLIVCAWARERRPRIRGLVVSSPALRASGLSPLRRRLFQVLRRIRPKATIESELDAEGLSRDPAVVQAYLADPLVNLRMTFSLGAELFAAMERTAPGGGDVTLPMLLVQGEEDPLCAPEASEAFARAAPDCRYRSYPGLRHEIFNEPEQESVFADVQGWIEEIGKRQATPESI